MLAGYPDYGKASTSYLLAITEWVSNLSPVEQGVLADTRTGIATRCKFLPTIAEMQELLDERRAAKEQFVPAHTTHKYFPPEPELSGPQVRRERVQQLVDELRRVHAPRAAFDTIPIDQFKSSDDLKTPPGPISRELKKLLIEQGYQHLQNPFPELWEVFASEPRLLQGHSFDLLTAASRQLAMHGRDAARRVLDPLAEMTPE